MAELFTVVDCARAVEREMCLPVGSVLGPRQDWCSVNARAVVICIALERGMSLCGIAARMGRNHTTIMHARNRMHVYMARPGVSETYDVVIARYG